MKKTISVALAIALGLIVAGCSADKSSDSQVIQTDAAAKAAAASTPAAPGTKTIPADVQSKMPPVAPGVGGGGK